MHHLTLIVATDRQNGIGRNNALPWQLPEDLAHFKQTTLGHTIVMGRKTFESIGRALPGRRNIVVTRDTNWQPEGVTIAHSIEAALHEARAEKIFVIGGAQIYAETLARATRLIVTWIDASFDCDAHFPAIDPAQWGEISHTPLHTSKSGLRYAFVEYERITH